MRAVITIAFYIAIVVIVFADSQTYGRRKSGYAYSTNRMPSAQYDACRLWLHPVTDGQTNWWDYSEHTNDAHESGGAYSTNGYFVLDGTNDVVIVPDSKAVEFVSGGADTEMSAFLWLRPHAAWGGGGAVMTKNNLYNVGDYYMLFAGGSTYVRLLGSPTAAFIEQHVAIVPAVGIWQHWGWTYTGSEAASGIKIFRNGLPLSTTPASSGSYVGMGASTNDFRVGRRGGDATFFRGWFSDLRLMQKTLTTGEVYQLYLSTSNTYYP